MSQASNRWYIRLPEGRVVRASDTEAVRHHIRSGRIPLDSRVRQSSEEEWTTLEWTSEFADLYKRMMAGTDSASVDRDAGAGRVRPATIASRLDPHQLQTVGIRGAVEELLAALDSTMVRVKLRVAGVTGLFLGLAVAVMYLIVNDPQSELLWWGWPAFGLVIVFLTAVCQALLLQITYAEVSHLRPARWKDGQIGLIGHVFHIMLANGVVFGLVCTALVLLRQWPEHFPDWYRARYNLDHLATFRDVVGVTAFLGELLLWPILSLGLLLGPLVVVENGSAFSALWQWLRLLGRHLGEVFLYQSVALSMGVMVTLPLVLTLALASWGAGSGETEDKTLRGVFTVLGGVALTPLIAYLMVANLFVYLHVRYEQGAARR